jgi:Uma2 family endonuclease/DNA-binding XRE family transcriptional regulator
MSFPGMNNRLRTLRTERNWSQASLAKRLDVSRQTINALETGKSDPSLPLAFKIAQLFNCPLEQIFFLEQKSMFARSFSPDDSFDRLSQQAAEVLKYAQNESRHLRHKYIGTEQILLGLLTLKTSFSAQLLHSMGINLQSIRVEVEKIIGRGSSLFAAEISYTPRAKRVLEIALEAANQSGSDEIGTEHLLLGLIDEKDGLAARVLENFRINLGNLRQQVLEQLQQDTREYDEPSTLQRTRQFNWSAGSEPSTSNTECPLDFTSGEINARLSARLLSWVEPRRLGRVVAQSGFRLPNGDVWVPRLAFISQERLKRIPRTYPELAPDLVVEIKSAFDRVGILEEKIQVFLEQGAQVGLLIDPDEQTVACYRLGNEVVMLGNGDILTNLELLPGWELPVSELWPTVFEQLEGSRTPCC